MENSLVNSIENSLENSIESSLENSIESYITDDSLNNSITYDEENTELCNEYKYSENIEENQNITTKEFIKLLENNNELILLINNSKKNLNSITKLLFYLKKKNIKLAYNIMDNPGFYFKKIFSELNNIYLNKYSNKISEIQYILPNLNKIQIYEALNVCNFDIEQSINYLCEYNIVII